MKTMAVLAVMAALCLPDAGQSQYRSYGVSFSNPVTAQMNTDVNSGIGSRLVYRMILKKHGYKDPELGQMKTEEMYNLIQSGNYAPRGGEGQKPTPQAIAQTIVPDKPASRFKPAGKRLLLPDMVKSLTDNAEFQGALIDVFETGIKEFEKEAKKHGLVNDVAGSIAFFIGCAYTVCKDGEEPSTDGLVLIARALQLHFNTEEFRKIPDTDKQKFYELMGALGTYLVATRQTAIDTKDEALGETIKKAAADTLKGYLKLDSAKFKITGNGVEIDK